MAHSKLKVKLNLKKSAPNIAGKPFLPICNKLNLLFQNMSEMLPSSAKLIQDAVTQTTPLSLSTR